MIACGNSILRCKMDGRGTAPPLHCLAEIGTLNYKLNSWLKQQKFSEFQQNGGGNEHFLDILSDSVHNNIELQKR